MISRCFFLVYTIDSPSQEYSVSSCWLLFLLLFPLFIIIIYFFLLAYLYDIFFFEACVCGHFRWHEVVEFSFFLFCCSDAFSYSALIPSVSPSFFFSSCTKLIIKKKYYNRVYRVLPTFIYIALRKHMFSSIVFGVLAILMVGNFVPLPLVGAVRGVIFQFFYHLYCTEIVGYRFLKKLVHPASPIPHSDYRAGVRCLYEPCAALPVFVPNRPEDADPNLSAAQLARLRHKKWFGVGGPALDVRNFNVVDAETVKKTSALLIVPIPIFGDNYAYAIISLRTQKMALVDPADPETCLTYLERFRRYTGLPLQLTEVLTTHKHWDHAGGNQHLRNFAADEKNGGQLVSKNLSLIGPKADTPMACDRLVDNGEVLTVMDGGAVVRGITAPGHTQGSMIFSVGDTMAHEGKQEYLAVFTGDSLFCGGCGNPFETTSIQQIMDTREALFKSAAQHPNSSEHVVVPDDRVLIYPGHEYTTRLIQSHLFCMRKTLEQNAGDAAYHEAISNYITTLSVAYAEARDLRRFQDDLPSQDVKSATLPLCTVPSTLATEKKINPLLTLSDADIHLAQPDQGGPLNKEILEQALYCSRNRQIR